MLGIDGWLGQLVGSAAALGTLAAIYERGRHVGKRERQRDLEKEIGAAETLLEAARNEASALRTEANQWKNRFLEVGSTSGPDSPQSKLESIRAVISRPNSLWFDTPVSVRPPIKSVQAGGKPIVTIGNLKGGVGKTTIAAQASAILGKQGFKVLLIDFDYQGSASTFLLRAAGREDVAAMGERSRASQLIDYPENESDLARLVIPLGDDVPNVSVIPAYYPLADAEEGKMLSWVLGDEPADIRFNLSRHLQGTALDFDVVIIDAPPRLSTAMVQALAASTHVLVPSQLNRVAGEASIYFARVLKSILISSLNPQLEFLGVVPNMVQESTGFSAREIAEMNYLDAEIGKSFPGVDAVWRHTPIYDKVALNRPKLVTSTGADQGTKDALAALTKLAEAVRTRVGLEAR